MSEARGFELRELRLCGPGVRPARLVFSSGLNVIEGASDTGKSYAVSCIDFLLGAKDPPEEIPEARGYDVAYLSLVARTGRFFTLKRAMTGGAIGLVEGSLEEALAATGSAWRSLGLKADSRDSISGFLLGLCGLANKRVRSNAYGKTQAVSFRVLVNALIVDEQRIIAKSSPLYGGRGFGDTAAESTIRLLLTGIDDSQIVQPEDKKVAAGRLAGKKEVVASLIAQDEASLTELLGERDPPTEQDLAELDGIVAEMSSRSSAALVELQAAEADRRQAWGDRRNHNERLRELDGLLGRAELLGEHYLSDLRRLEAMGESAHVLEHYAEEPCAYCGADPEHQHHDDSAALQAVIEAARVEASKVQRLNMELELAVLQMRTERTDARQHVATLDDRIGALSRSIDDDLAPRTRTTSARLQELHDLYGKALRIREIQARLESLRENLERLESARGTREKPEFKTLSAATMSGVAKEVSLLLDAWGFASTPAVSYDEKSADLQIDGRPRVSHGKGVRAVSCAAFVVAIMRHGMENDLGHPGFVVVDTPLNPYKAADPSDGGAVAQPVKSTFYRHLCSTTPPGQVIVFENEAAPQDVQAACNYVHFTGSAAGRPGFIPGPEPSGAS